jgi:hypothetical protein
MRVDLLATPDNCIPANPMPAYLLHDGPANTRRWRKLREELLRTRREVLPGGGLGQVGVGVGAMGLMRGTMGLIRGTLQELPVGAILQVVRQRHLINGAMRAHDSLCARRMHTVSIPRYIPTLSGLCGQMMASAPGACKYSARLSRRPPATLQ